MQSPTRCRTPATSPTKLSDLKIAAEAHRQGMLVWAHGMVFPATPQEVIDAKPDTMSHTGYLAYQALRSEDRRRSASTRHVGLGPRNGFPSHAAGGDRCKARHDVAHRLPRLPSSPI